MFKKKNIDHFNKLEALIAEGKETLKKNIAENDKLALKQSQTEKSLRDHIKQLEDDKRSLKKLLKDNVKDTFSYKIQYHPKVELYHLSVTRHYISIRGYYVDDEVHNAEDSVDLKTWYFKTKEAAKAYAEDTIKKLQDNK